MMCSAVFNVIDENCKYAGWLVGCYPLGDVSQKISPIFDVMVNAYRGPRKPHQSQQNLGVFTGTTATHQNKNRKAPRPPCHFFRRENGHQRVNEGVPTESLACQPHYIIPSRLHTLFFYPFPLKQEAELVSE